MEKKLGGKAHLEVQRLCRKVYNSLKNLNNTTLPKWKVTAYIFTWYLLRSLLLCATVLLNQKLDYYNKDCEMGEVNNHCDSESTKYFWRLRRGKNRPKRQKRLNETADEKENRLTMRRQGYRKRIETGKGKKMDDRFNYSISV